MNKRPSAEIGNHLLRSGRSNEQVEVNRNSGGGRNSGYNLHGSTSGEQQPFQVVQKVDIERAESPQRIPLNKVRLHDKDEVTPSIE